ncbi:MAG: hypothetical protein Q9227_007034 [Pyrenula ochraceoflavens]
MVHWQYDVGLHHCTRKDVQNAPLPAPTKTCSDDQLNVIKTELDAAKSWLSASVDRLDHFSKPTDGSTDYPKDIYYKSLFQSDNLNSDSFDMVQNIKKLQDSAATPLSWPENQDQIVCHSTEDPCNDMGFWGVYWPTGLGQRQGWYFCKSWFDDSNRLPAATIQSQCKGEEAKYYSASQIRYSKRS